MVWESGAPETMYGGCGILCKKHHGELLEQLWETLRQALYRERIPSPQMAGTPAWIFECRGDLSESPLFTVLSTTPHIHLCSHGAN